MEVKLFIDYSNFNWDKVSLPAILLDVSSLELFKGLGNVKIKVRLYGGWYFEDIFTNQRISAIEKIGSWPSIFRNQSNAIVRVNYSFADTIINGSGPLCEIKSTFVKRGSKPRNIRVHSACDADDCQLKLVKKWLNTRKACTSENCKKDFSDIFYRFEQKQVDTHLVSDFLMSACADTSGGLFGIVGNDIDMLPAIKSVIYNNGGENVLVVQSKKTFWPEERDLEEAGVNFIKVEEG